MEPCRKPRVAVRTMTRTGALCCPGAVALGGIAERSAPGEQPETAIEAVSNAAPVRERIDLEFLSCQIAAAFSPFNTSVAPR
jgi:hypothetical protein